MFTDNTFHCKGIVRGGKAHYIAFSIDYTGIDPNIRIQSLASFICSSKCVFESR